MLYEFSQIPDSDDLQSFTDFYFPQIFGNSLIAKVWQLNKKSHSIPTSLNPKKKPKLF